MDTVLPNAFDFFFYLGTRPNTNRSENVKYNCLRVKCVDSFRKKNDRVHSNKISNSTRRRHTNCSHVRTRPKKRFDRVPSLRLKSPCDVLDDSPTVIVARVLALNCVQISLLESIRKTRGHGKNTANTYRCANIFRRFFFDNTSIKSYINKI